MSYIDIILCIPLLWGIYKGFKKGFIIQAASLIALILGIYGGIKLSGIVSEYLQSTINIKPQYLSIISFALIFLIIVIAVHFLAKLLAKFIKLVALGFINRIVGAIFGLVKVSFILSAILFIINVADKKLNFIPPPQKDKSVLYEPLSELIPMIIPTAKELVEWKNPQGF